MSAKSGIVAKRYAAALLDMAAEAGSVQQVEKDFSELQAMLKSSDDLRALVSSPLAGRGQQNGVLAALAEKAKFHKLTANFLGVLAQNRRLAALDGVIQAFRAEMTRRSGGIEAKVQSAVALSPAQTKALQEQLSKAMGANVTMDVTVNRDLLGGMIVTVGSRMIDDSVKRKLEKLQRAMSEKAA
jgi:F-type H+-transporting ATPase subunit delta